MSSNFTPTSPQLGHSSQATPAPDLKDSAGDTLPEEKKAQKKILADAKQIAEARKKHGKLRISDLVHLGGSSSDEEGSSPISSPTGQGPSPATLALGTPVQRVAPASMPIPLPLEAPPIHAPTGWPYELILVRHGQSEGNEAVARSELGDLSAYTPEFRNKHSSSYRLTDKGVEQAKVTGAWIRDNIGDTFDRYYTSEYVRAMETAAHLGLPEAKWYTEIVLRERDKGLMDNTSAIDKKTTFAEDMERRKRDSFFWAPPSGESLANVCIRIDHTLNTLRRECANQRVVIVCHGEVMWAFRVRIERLSQIAFHRLIKSDNPKDKIHNGQVLHYTRINPITGEVHPTFKFLRSSCPWKPQYSADDWVEFDRPIYSNEELLQSVMTVPRFVNNRKDQSPDQDEKVNY